MNNAVRGNWREASSLIVLSKRTGGAAAASGGCNYDLLLQTRTSNATFKNSVVFPGGVSEASDASPQWLQLLRSFGYSQTDFETLHRPGAPLTPLFQNNPVLRHITFRITAIRETFEELGLLLCSRTAKEDNGTARTSVISDFDIKYWQQQVSKDPLKLLNLCKELQCYPDIWSLHYWSNWLTPTYHKSRFNTAFYVTTLDSRPEVYPSSEVAKIEWLSPREILKRNIESDSVLYLPQAYELNRLAHWSDIQELKSFATQRSNLGGYLYYHAIICATDGCIFVVPGDDLYPEPPIDYDKQPVIKSDKTILELRESSKSAHRFEIYDSHAYIVFKNFKPDNIDMGDRMIKTNVTLGS